MWWGSYISWIYVSLQSPNVQFVALKRVAFNRNRKASSLCQEVNEGFPSPVKKTRLFYLFMMLGWNSVSFASLMTHPMSYSLGKRILVSWMWLWCSLLLLCSALKTFLVVYEVEMLVVFFQSGLNWQMVCPVQTWMDWQGILYVLGIFSYGAVESIVLAWQASTFNFVSWTVSCLYGRRLYGRKEGQQPRSSSEGWVDCLWWVEISVSVGQATQHSIPGSGTGRNLSEPRLWPGFR
jgi:hypothetical protein